MGRRVASPTREDRIEEDTSSIALLFPGAASVELSRKGRHVKDSEQAAAQRRMFVYQHQGLS